MRCLTHTEVKSALSASWAYGADLIRVFYTRSNIRRISGKPPFALATSYQGDAYLFEYS